MFHAVIILIATCFGCTLYHFYAFSGTNLLTRCHSASSVFSTVFPFQKSYTENILGIGRNLFLRTYNIGKLPEDRRPPREEAPGAHTPWGHGPRPRPARVWWPWLAPGSHPSPIYSPSHEYPNTIAHIPRKVLSRPSSSISDRRSSEALPGTMPEGRSSPEASTPPCLPQE